MKAGRPSTEPEPGSGRSMSGMQRPMPPTRNTLPLSRRAFTAGLGVAAVALAAPAISAAKAPRVVIIGAGPGGATVARSLKARLGGKAEITVLAGPSAQYRAPFLGNALMLGEAVPDTVPLARRLDGAGVRTVLGMARALDRGAKTVSVQHDGARSDLAYDLLVAAPGVALRPFGADNTADDGRNACWTANSDCAAVAAGLARLPEGGTLAIAAPAQPYRCPPAIYERACLIAHRLKKTNSAAKILIIDDKDQYPMQALFEAAYTDYYEDMIEWVPRDFHGGIQRLDAAAGTIETESDSFEADVLHAVPPQSAPDFLLRAGLGDDRGYCPIEAASMRARDDAEVYIVGDAAAAGEMSKAAVSAVVQGKIAARDIAERLTGRKETAPLEIADQCWSFLAPDDAVTLGGRYEPDGATFHSIERFVSDVEESAEHRRENARRAAAWPSVAIWDIYGTDT